MQAKDWLERWEKNHIGFHQDDVNSYLRRYFNDFGLKPGDRIFLPLCGKAHDIAWLAKQGFEVIGIELSSIAIDAFFAEYNMQYRQFQSDRFVMRMSDNIVLLEGDYFDLQAQDLAGCKLVFDRAALIAMGGSDRGRYCEHMQAMTAEADNMLLVTLTYDQSVMSGPPYSVTADEVHQHYQQIYEVELLEQYEIVDEMPRWRDKGLKSLQESVFRLRRKVA